MKNVLSISTAGQDLLYSADDGTNRLIINGTEIPSSSWTGTGTYTTTVEGHTVTITKAASLTGNLMLAETGRYTYEFRSFTEAQPVTGVKGNSESTYRTGNVNLTPANIGLQNYSASEGNVGSSVAVASDTSWHSLGSFKLPAGKWIVYIYGSFPNFGTSGRRAIVLSTAQDSPAMVNDVCLDQRAPISGYPTICRIVAFLGPTAETTYYVNANQNSGSSLNVTAKYGAWRILPA